MSKARRDKRAANKMRDMWGGPPKSLIELPDPGYRPVVTGYIPNTKDCTIQDITPPE